MICSSLARNRSPDPVVSCCFGRIVPSDATTESQFASKGNPENEIARFRALKPQYLAISILPARQKQILRQWASRCSRTTNAPRGQAIFVPERLWQNDQRSCGSLSLR